MSDWRKVWSFTVGEHKATVQRSAEWQEFRVRLSGPEGVNEAATYFTSDRTDAITTARTMAYQAARQNIPG